MELRDLLNIQIEKNYIEDIIKHKEYNDVIISHYQRLSEEFPEVNFSGNIENMINCNSWWVMDHYQEQKIKDFKKTSLCKDKFCSNCKKVKQASRLTQFMPLIEEMKKDKYIYHLVLTVPNCNGTNLKATIKDIFSNFYKLNRYLKLEKKIKGLDFEQYCYSGSIRSLEVTFNKDSYHPHLHCIIAMDSPLDENRHIKNTYSKSRKNGYRKFTDFEILIQKIWYLLNNSEKVTKKNIDNLDVGYSCTIDSIDDSSVFEVFKYMTKTKDEKDNIIPYDNFKVLYFALYRVRQIQGYGCFYNVKDDDSIIDQVDDLYDIYVQIWKAKENPVEVCETPQDLLKDTENLIVSRKRIFNMLRNL
ncbi:MAG: protein rep [Peptostreptococcaceae bacterium]